MSASGDFGEVRAWLASSAHAGPSLHDVLASWSDTAQLTREVLPYLRAQLRRLDVRVAPTDGVPCSAWFDVWLAEAYALDASGDVKGARAVYEDCLRIKPDCIPARVNHFRLRHRGVPFENVLAGHTWEAHGPYGDESWDVVREAVRVMDQVDADAFVQLLDSTWNDVEHQSTLYPSTLALAYFLMCMLDRRDALDATIREAALDWLSTVAGWVLAPFLIRDDEMRGDPEEMWSALDTLSGCMDLEFASLSRDEENVWWAERRCQSVWPRDASFGGYEEYERCDLPCFPDEVFVRASPTAPVPQHMIYDGLHGVLYQVIAAGLPLYRKVQQVRRGEADWLVCCGGHLAQRDRDEVLGRLGRPGVITMMANMTRQW